MNSFRRVAIAAGLAFAFAFGSVQAAWAANRVKVSVASASAGAAAYVMMGGLAALISKESKTVQMSNLTTRGGVEDIRLIESGKSEFAVGVAVLVKLALKGKKMFKKKYTNIRGVGPMTAAMIHIGTAKRSGITKVEQLAGKRVSFAKKGSAIHAIMSNVVKIAGIKVRREYLNWNVAADAVRDNRLDAFAIPNPIPSPAFVKLSTSTPINLLPIEGKVRKGLLKLNSAFFEISIPAGAYNGVTKAVPTIGFTAWNIAGAKVPADIVYEVTRLNFSKIGKRFLGRVHKGWTIGFKIAPALDQMAAIGMKLHPGAERYWKEQGHKIPKKIAN